MVRVAKGNQGRRLRERFFIAGLVNIREEVLISPWEFTVNYYHEPDY
jgi:hypothetical protein